MNAEETTKLIQSMFAAKGSGGYDDFPGVVCPYCKSQPTFTHLERPRYFPADNYQAAGIYDIGVRGSVVVLCFSCEAGHEWALVMGEHKGAIEVKIMLTAFPADEDGN